MLMQRNQTHLASFRCFDSYGMDNVLSRFLWIENLARVIKTLLAQPKVTAATRARWPSSYYDFIPAILLVIFFSFCLSHSVTFSSYSVFN